MSFISWLEGDPGLWEEKSVPEFQCQRCGRCCSDPDLVVTLTHRDLWQLLNVCEERNLKFRDFFTFYALEENDQDLACRMVLPPLITSHGPVYIGLRRAPSGTCLFLRNSDNSCSIYENRPQACRNYPFSFSLESGSGSDPRVSLVRNSAMNCPALRDAKKIIVSGETRELGLDTIRDIRRFQEVAREMEREANDVGALTADQVLFILLSVAKKEYG